jgi:hypothetical protein
MPAIHFTERNLREFANIHPMLHDLFWWTVANWEPHWGPIRVGDIFRTDQENDDVGAKTKMHCQTPHRAIDIGGAGIPQAQLDAFTAKAAEVFIYDPSRPKMRSVYTAKHGTGPHFHLQVHPHTALATAPRA